MTHRLSITTLIAAAVSLVHALATRGLAVYPPPHFSSSGKSLPSSDPPYPDRRRRVSGARPGLAASLVRKSLPSSTLVSTSRRLAPLPLLLLIGLAVLVALLPTSSSVQAQTPANQAATGRPVVLVSAEGAGILAADTWRIADGNGISYIDFRDTVDARG